MKLVVWALSLIFLHFFTLFVIDIHKIMLISLFPTPFGHFQLLGSAGQNPKLILTLCLIFYISHCYFLFVNLALKDTYSCMTEWSFGFSKPYWYGHDQEEEEVGEIQSFFQNSFLSNSGSRHLRFLLSVPELLCMAF